MIDSHCHLQRSIYKDDLDAVIERAERGGVEALVTIGSSGSLDICREAVELAESRQSIYATVGYHPHDARLAGDTEIGVIADLARRQRVVALGETGLDYHYEHSPRDVQRRLFRRFIGLARDVGKPVVVHSRESDDDCIRVLDEERAEDVGGVIHCFTSSWELARAALDKGFYLGFTGIITFKGAESVRDVLRRTPHDRIVVETDSPYLSPMPHRGRQNEPAYVAHVVACLAETLGLDFDAARALTAENTRRLFDLPDPQYRQSPTAEPR